MFYFWRNCNRFLQQSVESRAAAIQVRFAKAIKALSGFPEKPKKPPTTWLLFLKERYNELKQQPEYEDLSLVELSKRISEEWRSFDEIDKIPYQEKYDESLEEYKRKIADYRESLTEENKRVLRGIKSESKKDITAFKKEFPKPKYPGSGYNLFVKSYFRERPRSEGDDVKDWLRDCGRRWQNLDEDAKMRLNEEMSPLGRKYWEDLREWKEKYKVTYCGNALQTLKAAPNKHLY